MSRADPDPASPPPSERVVAARVAGFALKLPIHAYRYSLKAFLGWHCRHLPTCSEYALEAIDRNGPWRGLWLTLSRLWRCRPGGTRGFDPVPDTRAEHHPLAPWRHGRWRSLSCGCASDVSPASRATPVPECRWHGTRR